MSLRLGAMRVLATLALLGWSGAVQAALTITPLTWNVIGLDSNNVNTGPNIYPVGARVCNVSASASGPVTAQLLLDGPVNPFIALASASSITVPALAAGGAPPSPYTIGATPANCADFHFQVAITRTSAAWFTTQRYYIEATDGASTVQTPRPRELYVEKLVSQSRNAVDSFSGPTTVYVGQTVQYNVAGHTATQGYEQVSLFPQLSVLFRLLSASATYSKPTAGTVNSGVYADACGWVNDPTSPDYHNNGACNLADNYSGGKAGGNVTTAYTIKILSAGTSTLTNVFYDFSGSSYHYNADFGTGVNALTVTAINPSPVTGTKSFAPGAIVTGQTSTLTITLNNPNTIALTGTAFTDVFPTTPGAMTLASTSTTNTCGGTLTDSGGGSLNVGDVGIGLTGGSIPAGGSCSITAVVAVSAAGTYTNTIAAGGVTTDLGGTATNAAAISGTLAANAPLTVVKASSVVTDPVNCTVPGDAASCTRPPRRLPGAVVEYTVVLTNGGPAAAVSIVATDAIPAGLTYRVGSIVVAGVAEDDDATGADETDPNGADFGVSGGGAVTARIATLSAGGSATVTFRGTVN